MPTLRADWVSDVGRCRTTNEDAVLAGRGILAVADGLGGHEAGEVASALAIARLAELDAGVAITTDRIHDAVALANADIVRHTLDHPEAAGMGTTLSGIAAVQVAGRPHWALFNVGDSRVYRMVDGELARATVDHSEVEELILSGLLSEEEAQRAPNRNVITRSLGTDDSPRVDLWVLPPFLGERFLICTDGLCTEVTDAAIAEVLRANPRPADACAALLEAALDAGGADNISVIVAEVIDPEVPDELGVTTPRNWLNKDRK